MLLNAVADLKEARKEMASCYSLTPSAKLFERTSKIYERVKGVISPAEWMMYAPYIDQINTLKIEKNAVILAHNYMTPEIYHGVADFVGDSLQLALKAQQVEHSTIVQCGVHFMAETSKILNPNKTVLIPDSRAGCSLAASISPADILEMRRQTPGARVVSYVNTSAEVKAESDACCTSSNIVEIIEAMDTDTVIVTPDQYLAENVREYVSKKLVVWKGFCEVHERFTPEELQMYRKQFPGIRIIAHPECPPAVIKEADFSGSTSAMIAWVRENKPERVAMITECSMSDNVAAEMPDIEFIRPCNLCPHMKRISLENILWCLHSSSEEVFVDPHVAQRACVAVHRMLAISRGDNPWVGVCS